MNGKLQLYIKNVIPRAWRVPIRGSRLSHAQFLEIVWGFACDETASETAKQGGVSVRTVNALFRLLRRRLTEITMATISPNDDDEYDFRIFHDTRVSRHPGWRHRYHAEYEHESRCRFALRARSRVWLFYFMLEDLYDRDLRRAPPLKPEWQLPLDYIDDPID